MLTADELEALVAKATQGPWDTYAQTIDASSLERRVANAKAEMLLQVEQTNPIGDTLYLLAAGDKCPATTGCGPTSKANASLITALVNNAPRLIEALRASEKQAERVALHVVFDGPPGPVAGRFVECETPDGWSINAGEWHSRDDGLWELRIPNALPAPPATEAGE